MNPLHAATSCTLFSCAMFLLTSCAASSSSSSVAPESTPTSTNALRASASPATLPLNACGIHIERICVSPHGTRFDLILTNTTDQELALSWLGLEALLGTTTITLRGTIHPLLADAGPPRFVSTPPLHFQPDQLLLAPHESRSTHILLEHVTIDPRFHADAAKLALKHNLIGYPFRRQIPVCGIDVAFTTRVYEIR